MHGKINKFGTLVFSDTIFDSMLELKTTSSLPFVMIDLNGWDLNGILRCSLVLCQIQGLFSIKRFNIR
jgi:hypothetical protein